MKLHDREAAFRALEDLVSRPIEVADLDALSVLLSHPYQYVRTRAAELLGHLHATSAARLLAISLSDRSEYVAAAAANSLARIGTDAALEALRCAFADDELERPHYLANAIASFGRQGFALLVEFSKAESATLRYFAARGLGSTNVVEAAPILESLRDDTARTRFGGQVGTAAKDGLKTLKRMQDHAKSG